MSLPKLSALTDHDKRHHNATAYVLATAASAAATNGHALAIVQHADAPDPWDWAPGTPARVLVPWEVWQRGERDRGRTTIGGDFLLLSTGERVPFTFRDPSHYPDLTRIESAHIPGSTSVVRLNPHLLAALADALTLKDSPFLTIEHPKAEDRPLKVTGPLGVGYCMPARKPTTHEA